MSKKLTIQTTKNPAIIINRVAVSVESLVYIAISNKPLNYKSGKSKIAYIGTTKAGSDRIAASASAKAKELLNNHGIKTLQFFVVTCKSRQKVKTWRKLERALLLTFRETFGEIPLCNHQGNRMKWIDEEKYFTKNRLRTIIEKYSNITY